MLNNKCKKQKIIIIIKILDLVQYLWKLFKTFISVVRPNFNIVSIFKICLFIVSEIMTK